ncbi:MAG: glycerophosphodiester phosphodiesterase [Citrobacter freundii]|nr:MAG: glycerophosphodiester phosphodiesterase [Citrobacter freundii]
MSINSIILHAQARSFEQLRREFLNASSNKVLVAAHRGAHLDAPENSLQAFQGAIDMGIDIIELDVRCTKDGQLVVIHDKTVDRTTNGKGAVDSLSFDQIRKLRLMFNGQLTGQLVPTLQEALMLTRGKILVDLDIKSVSCIDKIMQEVKAAGAASNCFFFVTKVDQVKMLKQYDAGFSTLLRTTSEKAVKDALSAVKTEAIHIDTSHNEATVISQIRSAGARVWINALGEIDEKAAAGNVEVFERLLMNGANIIQTDQPALLKQYLKSINRYW